MDQRLSFNLLEILDLAQKIEENGETFYRKAAVAYPAHADFLLKMAEQEKGHGLVFKNISERIEDSDERHINDPDGIVKSHLDAIADGLIFDTDSDLSEYFGKGHRIEEIMDAAIEREEDTILFFEETQKLLKNREDNSTLNELIQEENDHIAWINQQRSELPWSPTLTEARNNDD